MSARRRSNPAEIRRMRRYILHLYRFGLPRAIRLSLYGCVSLVDDRQICSRLIDLYTDLTNASGHRWKVFAELRHIKDQNGNGDTNGKDIRMSCNEYIS